jgi:hypothetical protein
MGKNDLLRVPLEHASQGTGVAAAGPGLTGVIVDPLASVSPPGI